MWYPLTPARRRGVEVLDDPMTPADVRERSMADVVCANELFGGAESALSAFRRMVRNGRPGMLLLDVGTGLADIPAQAQRYARDNGIALTTVGLDASESLLCVARDRLDGAVVGNALRLPIADGSADIVVCSQLLHHFADDDARRLIAELHRVAGTWVVISDLRRSWLAAAGFWLASIALRFHRVTRHDGVTSVLRGFTARELEALVFEATGIKPRVRHGVFWRLSATWHKSAIDLFAR